MGKTPLTLYDISPGKHKVTLVLVDYEKYAQEVEVIAGKTIDLSTTLVSIKPKPPSVGKLVLVSTPSSAKVYLNNTYKGTTPLTIDQLKPGDYQLKLSKDGYQDWSKKVTVVTSKTNTLSVSLIAIPKPAPIYGQLSIDSTPSAQVCLNDQVKGSTPLTLDNLNPGTYQLKLTKEGYQDFQKEVQIKAGETTQITTTTLSPVPKKEEPAPKEEDEEYQQLFQQGRDYYDTGFYKRAVPLLRQALNIDDTDWELHYYLGQTYQALEDYNPAIEYYQNAIILKPREYMLYFGLGNIYNQIKLYRDAIEAYERAIQINPEPDILYTRIAIACSNAALPSDAIKYHKKAISINPLNTSSYAELADIYFDNDLYALALGSYREANRIDPNNEQLHFRMGRTYYKDGQYTDAISYLNRAIGTDETHASAYYFLGLTYLELEDKALALKQYEILKNLDTSLAEKLKGLIGK